MLKIINVKVILFFQKGTCKMEDNVTALGKISEQEYIAINFPSAL